MIQDFRFRSDPKGAGGKRRRYLPLLVPIGLATLCATALFASMQANKPALSPAGEIAEQTELLLPLTLPKNDTPSAEFSDAAGETASGIATLEADSALPATTADSEDDSDEQTTAETSDESLSPVAESDLVVDEGTWHQETVKSGDSLAKIFDRLGLSANLLHRIIHSSKEAQELAKIRPGETLKVRIDGEGELMELIHQRSPILSLHVTPADDDFTTRVVQRDLEKRVSHATGIITDSLYQSAQRSGLSDAMIMELANIFGWDIDFALEIRSGDQFSLIFEEEYLDGEKYRNGVILAAEFVNRGKVFRAVRYEDENGSGNYFTPDGKSMRKAFLRAPVDFRRISSRFARERYHPVLGKKRPHRGVDYAASVGTPIKAAGDGKVIFRGTKGGYGRTVIIQHGEQYTTLYAHMSKYRGKVKSGSRVRQGQVIGYVGSSGMATGPHLHYEFRVNGVHRNPLTVKLPAALPISEKYRDDFEKQSAPLLARLTLIAKTLVADAG